MPISTVQILKYVKQCYGGFEIYSRWVPQPPHSNLCIWSAGKMPVAFLVVLQIQLGCRKTPKLEQRISVQLSSNNPWHLCDLKMTFTPLLQNTWRKIMRKYANQKTETGRLKYMSIIARRQLIVWLVLTVPITTLKTESR